MRYYPNLPPARLAPLLIKLFLLYIFIQLFCQQKGYAIKKPSASAFALQEEILKMLRIELSRMKQRASAGKWRLLSQEFQEIWDMLDMRHKLECGMGWDGKSGKRAKTLRGALSSGAKLRENFLFFVKKSLFASKLNKITSAERLFCDAKGEFLLFLFNKIPHLPYISCV